MNSEKVAMVGIVTVKDDKKKRAEELWKGIIDDINNTQSGGIRYNVFFEAEKDQYIVIAEFDSEAVRDAYLSGPICGETSKKVKAEGLLLGAENRIGRHVFGTS